MTTLGLLTSHKKDIFQRFLDQDRQITQHSTPSSTLSHELYEALKFITVNLILCLRESVFSHPCLLLRRKKKQNKTELFTPMMRTAIHEGQCRATIRNDKDDLWAQSLVLSLSLSLQSVFSRSIKSSTSSESCADFFVVKWDEASKGSRGEGAQLAMYFFFMFILVGWQMVTSLLLDFNNTFLLTWALLELTYHGPHER